MAGRFAMIVPTTRAATVLLLAAPLAVVLAAAAPATWIAAPALGAAILALVLGDALLAGRLAGFELALPDDIEVGADTDVTAQARFRGGIPANAELAIACDARLVAGGRLTMALAVSGTEGLTGRTTLRPARRGLAMVEHGWLRWSGPLRLGARQTRFALERRVRIRPNIAAVRSPALQRFLRDAQIGLIARRIRGEGSQFEALAEYQPGMDRRRIDWKASARHVQLYAKEYESERNNQIVFAFDCGQSMCEPVAGMPRLDRVVSAALATAYVALKSGDRLALFGFAARPEVSTPFFTDAHGFAALQRAAAELDYRAEEPNFTLALATLAGRLQRRSLIVVFSEFADPTSAALMIESIGRLVDRHVVLFVTMHDEELETLSAAPPIDMEALSMAVSADLLLNRRAMVTRQLRQIGVDVIEAPFDAIGPRLLDAYLAIKRSGLIG